MTGLRPRLCVWIGMASLAGCMSNGPCPPAAPAAPPPPPLVVAAPNTEAVHVTGAPFAVVRRRNYRIEFGEYGFEVDPTDGARILEFSLAGRSAIVSVSESPEAFGSSLWTSPQSDWSWPPPVELDRLPWKILESHDDLVLESEPSAKLGISVRQRLRAMPLVGTMRLEYVFTNRGANPRRVAPWQNTRVRPNGLIFYPASRPSYPIQYNTLVVTPEDGVAWYARGGAALKDSIKSFADGDEGWMAHLDGRLLFVKIFDDVPPPAQAPNEGEVVIYVSHSGKFLEMEHQGAYQELLPGASYTWTTYWALRRLPDGIDGRRGERALVEYARKTVAEVRAAK